MFSLWFIYIFIYFILKFIRSFAFFSREFISETNFAVEPHPNEHIAVLKVPTRKSMSNERNQIDYNKD